MSRVYEESRTRPLDGFAEPDLPFFLADALAQKSKAEPPGSAGEEPARRAIQLFEEYLSGPAAGAYQPQALVNLGVLETGLKNPAAARRSFAVFLKSYPGHELAPRVRFELANAHITEGSLEEAAAEYRRAAGEAQDPQLSARACLQAALLLRRLKQPAEAAALIREWIEKPFDRHREQLLATEEGRRLAQDAAYELGTALAEAGRPEEAKARWNLLLREHPAGFHEGEARLQLGHLLLDQGKAAEALEAIQPLLESRSARTVPAGSDQALYLQAWCLVRLAGGKSPDARRQEQAEAAYRRLIAEHAGSPLRLDAVVELAQLLYNRKERGEAKKRFGAAVEELERDPAAGKAGAAGIEPRRMQLLEQSLLGLGFIAFEEKDYGEASRHFDRLLSLRPDSPLAPRALFHSARAYQLSREERRAIERLEKLLDEPEERAGEFREEALLRLGECRHRLQRYDEAARALQRLLEEFPSGRLRHEARFALGFARQFQDRFDEAMAAYRQVAAEGPAEVAARSQYHLGECLVDRGKQREGAREFLAVAAGFEAAGPGGEWVRRALLAAGMAYQAAGDPAAAAPQFEELVKRFPQSEEGRAASKRLAEMKK